MQMTAHEAYDLHELIMSCVNSITNMAAFIEQAQDPELKAMIQRHFPLHVQDYNIKVELFNKNQVNMNLPVPNLNAENFQQTPVQVTPVTPRTMVNRFNDREIATAYLLTLKRAGREYAWTAMESGNPEIRSFLEDAFRMSSHHAFEVWQWMAQRGYYPVESANNRFIATVEQNYQTIPEQNMNYQQNANYQQNMPYQQQGMNYQQRNMHFQQPQYTPMMRQ